MSDALHIVLVNNLYPPHSSGGAELIVAYLAEELARRRHQVTVITSCGPEMEPYVSETVNDVRVVRFFPKNLYWSNDRVGRQPWEKALWHLGDAWNLSAASRVRALLSDRPPDVFHTHVIDGFSASIWRVAQNMGAAVVHTAHDYHLVCPRAFMMTRDFRLCVRPDITCRTYRHWHLGTTRYVDLFTSPSRFLLEQHCASGVLAKAVGVVANGIPARSTESKGRESHDSKRPLRLLLMARLTIEKGVRVALEALRRVPGDVPVTLDIAGSGVLRDEVERAAAQDARIRYHGFVSGAEKHQLFCDADCLVFPSLWYENAPVAIVEASAYGLAILASDLGAIPEFVNSETNGLLFPVGDAEALARTIIRIARNRELSDRFATNGPPFAAKFSVERMADDYLSHYARLLAERRHARS